MAFKHVDSKMNSKLISELSLKALSQNFNLDQGEPDLDRMYIPDCYRDRFAKILLQEALSLFQRPLEECTNFDINVDNFAANSIKHHFGIEE